MVFRLQHLRREFEALQMTSDETISDFLSKTVVVMSQMRTFGAKLDDKTIVEKVLHSLNSKFDHVIAANLRTYLFFHLMS